MSRRRAVVIGLVLLPFVLALLAVGTVLFMAQGGMAPYRIPHGGRTVAADPATVARGEYLARIGDCAACHSRRGGEAYAGGRAFRTGYGTIYSSNLGSDAEAGIGDWSPDEFAHVMRNGVSRRGPLYPVFPFAHFSGLTTADLDALYAYLHTLPPIATPVPANRLDFPASSRFALIAWRMLYYRPIAAPGAEPAQAVDASGRGRYLVDTLGHCAMCHSARGAGGSLPPQGYLAGGRIPGLGWYAPALDGRQLQRYSVEDLAGYLRSGTSRHGSAYGPMAEVVYASLQWLSAEDALAMAGYLKEVPPAPAPRAPLLPPEAEPTQPASVVDAAAIYRTSCAGCHGEDGDGKDGLYPPLRDSVALKAPDPVNAARIVLYGTMAPATAGNPQPLSMPPFVQQLDSAQIAAVINHLRKEAGIVETALSAADVEAMHGIALE